MKKPLLKLEVLLKIFYIIPIILTLSLILLWGVNVPYMDDWSSVQLFKSTLEHNLDFGLLFSQHNEHRMLIPKLIFLGLAYISKWNLKVQMLVSYLLALLNFFLIIHLSNITTTSTTQI